MAKSGNVWKTARKHIVKEDLNEFLSSRLKKLSEPTKGHRTGIFGTRSMGVLYKKNTEGKIFPPDSRTAYNYGITLRTQAFFMIDAPRREAVPASHVRRKALPLHPPLSAVRQRQRRSKHRNPERDRSP